MSVITKTGDKGETGVKGKRLAKDDLLIEVIGELDELMAVLGIVQKKLDDKKSVKELNLDLYKISGLLAGWEVKIDLKNKIKKMEVEIEKGEKEMEKISKFLKPGEGLNVWLNWARVVARRVERRLVSYIKKLETRNEKLDENVLIFINRLSDYLFTLGRKVER